MEGRAPSRPGYNPLVPEFTAKLSPSLDEIPRLAERVEIFAAGCGIADSVVMDLQLLLEEAVTNPVRHGGCSFVEVRLTLADGELRIEVIDDGVAYDPLARPPVDVDAPLEEREIGGLGVHLIRNLADEVKYARVDERNRLRMKKTLGGPTCHST
jgi:serine/threonine-protein kinase RsbW